MAVAAAAAAMPDNIRCPPPLPLPSLRCWQAATVSTATAAATLPAALPATVMPSMTPCCQASSPPRCHHHRRCPRRCQSKLPLPLSPPPHCHLPAVVLPPMTSHCCQAGCCRRSANTTAVATLPLAAAALPCRGTAADDTALLPSWPLLLRCCHHCRRCAFCHHHHCCHAAGKLPLSPSPPLPPCCHHASCHGAVADGATLPPSCQAGRRCRAATLLLQPCCGAALPPPPYCRIAIIVSSTSHPHHRSHMRPSPLPKLQFDC